MARRNTAQVVLEQNTRTATSRLIIPTVEDGRVAIGSCHGPAIQAFLRGTGHTFRNGSEVSEFLKGIVPSINGATVSA